MPGVAFVLVGAVTTALFLPALSVPSKAAATITWRAALLVVLVACLAALVARITFLSFTSGPHDRAREFTISCGLAGAWFVPAVALVAQNRWWAILAALLLGSVVGRLMRQCADPPDEPPSLQPLPAANAVLFAAYGSAGMSLGAAYSFGVAAVLHTALFALLGAQTAVAAVLTGGAAMLLAVRTQSEMRPAAAPSPWRDGIRVLRNTSLAIACTVLVLTGLPRFAHDSFLDDEQEGSGSSGGRWIARDLISGAILLADPRHLKSLIIPTPRRSVSLFSRGVAKRAVIEFSGVYWVFPRPRWRPSRDSMIVRESPLNYDFTAVDRASLSMQAHQDLPTAIDPRCCSVVEVEVRTVDKEPNTIVLELQLSMSDLLKAHRQSLGLQRVSKRGTEVLRFTLPAQPKIDKFDRIIVDFQLGGLRMNRSANLAIERFILIPAGSSTGAAAR